MTDTTEPSFTWNYRVVHTDTDSRYQWYSIHEVHYKGDRIIGYTEDPVGVVGDTHDELFGELNRMKDALSHPPIRLTELLTSIEEYDKSAPKPEISQTLNPSTS